MSTVQEKECFGARWEPGKDYGECQTQGIHSLPDRDKKE